MFTVTIHKDNETQIYSQTVERLDLTAVIQAVNATPPPEPAKRKRRKDLGKPRNAAVQPQLTGGTL